MGHAKYRPMRNEIDDTLPNRGGIGFSSCSKQVLPSKIFGFEYFNPRFVRLHANTPAQFRNQSFIKIKSMPKTEATNRLRHAKRAPSLGVKVMLRI